MPHITVAPSWPSDHFDYFLSLSHSLLHDFHFLALPRCFALCAMRCAVAGSHRVSIGLSALVPQVYRKATKKGFEFCMIVVGELNTNASAIEMEFG